MWSSQNTTNSKGPSTIKEGMHAPKVHRQVSKPTKDIKRKPFFSFCIDISWPHTLQNFFLNMWLGSVLLGLIKHIEENELIFTFS